MRVTRVFTAGALQAPGTATLDGSAAGHVARVLRLKPGDPLVLFNGDGREYQGKVGAASGNRVEVLLESACPGLPESPLAVTLAQGLARGERMDLVIQKATELGVARIVPLQAERSVVRLDARQAARKLEHWRAVALSACEQSGRNRPPVVESPRSLAEWLRDPDVPPCRLQLAPGAARPLAALQPGAGPVALLIGPEGGLTPDEQAQALAAGYEPHSAGPRILRTETAAIAALAILQAAAGDLR